MQLVREDIEKNNDKHGNGYGAATYSAVAYFCRPEDQDLATETVSYGLFARKMELLTLSTLVWARRHSGVLVLHIVLYRIKLFCPSQ